MKPTGNFMGTSDGGITFWGNGTLRSQVALEKGPVTISIRASGNRADGDVPAVRVMLANREVGKLRVDSTSSKEFTLKVDAESGGAVELTLSFDNYAAKTPALLSRWLVVNTVKVGKG